MHNLSSEKLFIWEFKLIFWLNEIVNNSIEALHYCKIDVKIIKNV